MVLSALPKPTELWWVKDTNEWFYMNYNARPFRLQWNRYSDRPRQLVLLETRAVTFTQSVAAAADEVHSLIPKIKQYDVTDKAVDELLRAACDYFTREERDGKWMLHKVLGRDMCERSL